MGLIAWIVWELRPNRGRQLKTSGRVFLFTLIRFVPLLEAAVDIGRWAERRFIYGPNRLRTHRCSTKRKVLSLFFLWRKDTKDIWEEMECSEQVHKRKWCILLCRPGIPLACTWRINGPPRTWSSIIIVTSLTLGADMIDGVPLMTLGLKLLFPQKWHGSI